MDKNDAPKKIPTSVALFSSSVSGALHIMIGYPFDTIKTLYQQNIYTKTYRIYTETSMKRLFQGIDLSTDAKHRYQFDLFWVE